MDYASLTKNIIEKEKLFDFSEENFAYLIDRNQIIYAFENLRKIIFPRYFGELSSVNNLDGYIEKLLIETKYILTEQLSVLMNRSDCKVNIDNIVDKFLSTIPEVQTLLNTDIDATFNNDPAAECKSQIVFSYPGITAITFYRLAHQLHKLKVPLIPRIITEYAHSVTGIDIHPGAEIGSSFCIDHGTGIVIGETTKIGDNVKIYQGVTLGALSIKNRDSLLSKKRHPTIENNVTLYAGCTVLGGDTVIGENSVIGGSTFVVKSIPANTIVSMELPKLRFKSQN